MWALGCMIYELCALKPPFLGDSFPALKRAVTAGRFQPMPRKYSEPLHRIVSSLIRVNPRDRPSAEAVLRSPDIANKLQLDDGTTSFGQPPQTARENLPSLIETIKVPQNLRKLNTALPKPCYPDVRPNSPSAWTMAEQKQSKMNIENVDQRKPNALNANNVLNRQQSSKDEGESYSIPSIRREVIRANEGLPSLSEQLGPSASDAKPVGAQRQVPALVKPTQAGGNRNRDRNSVESLSSAGSQQQLVSAQAPSARALGKPLQQQPPPAPQQQQAYPKVVAAANGAVYSSNQQGKPYVAHRMW